jgi:pilus assembly protein CpaE
MSAAPIKTLVAIDGGVDQRALEAVLGDPGIEVVDVLETHGELAERAGDLRVDAMLVACNGHPDVALAYVAEAVRERPSWPIVVVTTSSATALVREVITAGADDILTLTDTGQAGAETFFALQKAVTRRTGAPTDATATGELVCVLGPKGGTGKTLTTANLATALAQKGHSTVAVDLDLQFGDLGLALGCEPDRTIFDLATSGGTLDVDKLDAYVVTRPSGLRTLMAPMRPDQASGVTADFLRELYPVLRSAFDYTIVDTPPGFTPEVIATIDSATSICLVGMLDAPSLKNTRLGLETLGLMGVPSDRVRIVLNRAGTNVGITQADVLSVLGRAPDLLVPSSRDVVRSVNRGEPIVLATKRSDAAKAFRALADHYGEKPVAAVNGSAQTNGKRRFGRS